jgi:hypothetical protein
MRLIAAPMGGDVALYAAAPVDPDEFSSDAESLAWEGDGWEELQ